VPDLGHVPWQQFVHPSDRMIGGAFEGRARGRRPQHRWDRSRPAGIRKPAPTRPFPTGSANERSGAGRAIPIATAANRNGAAPNSAQKAPEILKSFKPLVRSSETLMRQASWLMALVERRADCAGYAFGGCWGTRGRFSARDPRKRAPEGGWPNPVLRTSGLAVSNNATGSSTPRSRR
jgi:hypothetical protein